MSEHLTKFHEKFSNFNTPVLAESICCWTDLLGFGRALYEAKWEPSEGIWASIFKRISEAHRDCYEQLDLSTEFALTLNDGIVRCCSPGELHHIQELSMWLRDCILTHNRINRRERRQGLPGARTILAHGKKLVHGPAQLTLEDFVFNYTNPNPDGPSSLPRDVAARVVASNPGPLQLNLAFSKAYILERLGSANGISGPHLYIDDSVIEAIRRFAGTVHPRQSSTEYQEGTTRVVGIANQDEQGFHLGFRLNLPHISIIRPEIETTVHRVEGFYPWDEPLPFVLPVE